MRANAVNHRSSSQHARTAFARSETGISMQPAPQAQLSEIFFLKKGACHAFRQLRKRLPVFVEGCVRYKEEGLPSALQTV